MDRGWGQRITIEPKFIPDVLPGDERSPEDQAAEAEKTAAVFTALGEAATTYPQVMLDALAVASHHDILNTAAKLKVGDQSPSAQVVRALAAVFTGNHDFNVDFDGHTNTQIQLVRQRGSEQGARMRRVGTYVRQLVAWNEQQTSMTDTAA